MLLVLGLTGFLSKCQAQSWELSTITRQAHGLTLHLSLSQRKPQGLLVCAGITDEGQS